MLYCGWRAHFPSDRVNETTIFDLMERSELLLLVHLGTGDPGRIVGWISEALSDINKCKELVKKKRIRFSIESDPFDS